MLLLIAVSGGLAAWSTRWGYQDAEITIVEFWDDAGWLSVRFSASYADGGCAGSMHLPRRVAVDDLEKLVGVKIPARIRTDRVLWLQPNELEVIESEICAAIDRHFARR
ncbi:MAG: hypothetical protein J5I93_18635 [Pirellulaceae bacterium]|nr:hypothetical protein [Pirellulaceae bacterium]